MLSLLSLTMTCNWSTHPDFSNLELNKERVRHKLLQVVVMKQQLQFHETKKIQKHCHTLSVFP